MYITGIHALTFAQQVSKSFDVLEKFTTNSPYLGAALVMGLAIVLAVVMLAVGGLIRIDKPDEEKITTYECGLDPTGDAMDKVKPRYYVYAMLFLAFEIELLFMFPWAVVFKDMEKIGYGDVAFFEMIMFIVILFVGLIYVWIKGALEWD